MNARKEVAAAFSVQASLCDGFGAPLYGELCRRSAVDVVAGGPMAGLTDGFDGEPRAASLPLRVLGGVHALVLSGAAPQLRPFYPSVGGRPEWPAAWHAFRATVSAQTAAIRPWLRRAPQTNEVGRSASLLGGFLLAASTGLPLRLLELGSSAGLNLRFDRYRIALGDLWFGPAEADVVLQPRWTGGTPPAVPLRIKSRAGCDLAPIDGADTAARDRLLAYVWPDRLDRFRRLQAALTVAANLPIPIAAADAVDWLADRLGEPEPGSATVVFHSSFFDYLPAPAQRALVDVIAAAGRRATAAAPLFWLRCDDEQPAPTDRPRLHELRLQSWPGGADRRLALCQPHGDHVTWLWS